MSRKTDAVAMPLSPASDVEEQFYDSIESFQSPDNSLTGISTEVANEVGQQHDMTAAVMLPPATSQHLPHHLHEKEVPTPRTKILYARLHTRAVDARRSSQTSLSNTQQLRKRLSLLSSQHESVSARFLQSDEDYGAQQQIGAQHTLYHTPSKTRLHQESQALIPGDFNREHENLVSDDQHALAQQNHVDLETLAALTGSLQAMEGGNEDLFMQVAEDSPRAERFTRRTWHDKRHSLTPFESRAITSMEERRPRTSGGLSGRPAPRLGQLQTELGRSLESRRISRGDADSTVSQPAYLDNPRQRRTTTQISPLTPLHDRSRSPEYTRFRPQTSARSRRPSQLAATVQEIETDSPADSSDPKRSVPESASADSQTADTVWDDLDDLKSRIKKLELVGKLPQTSGAAVSSSPQERPRTATTAPTTIDSSPKRNQKPEASTPTEATQSAYPLLHAALAKAKTLLSPQLYRSLEATATDALQLANMSSALSQRNFSSGVSVANGGSSDRQMKRKADMMCRNLTDLCLALCDGKHESPVTSPLNDLPVVSGRVSRASPSRSEFNPRSVSRPLSRLEARRSSILGANSLESPVSVSSPRVETSPEHTPSQQNAMDRQRYVRPSGRMTASAQYDDLSADEEPTVRAPSRIGSDFSVRSKRTSRDPTNTPQRSVSLREMLNSRRSSGAVESQDRRDLNRVASLSVDPSRRRWMRESTPPVLEEESAEQDYHESPEARPRSRIASFGQFSKLASRRGLTDSSTGRSSSLGQRSRQVVVE